MLDLIHAKSLVANARGVFGLNYAHTILGCHSALSVMACQTFAEAGKRVSGASVADGVSPMDSSRHGPA